MNMFVSTEATASATPVATEPRERAALTSAYMALEPWLRDLERAIKTVAILDDLDERDLSTLAIQNAKKAAVDLVAAYYAPLDNE